MMQRRRGNWSGKKTVPQDVDGTQHGQAHNLVKSGSPRRRAQGIQHSTSGTQEARTASAHIT